MLQVGYTNDGWSPSLGSQEMTTLGIMASQDLPFPGKRRLRGEVAELDARRSEQQLARARLWLAAEVKRAYSGLLLARELLVIAGEQKRDLAADRERPFARAMRWDKGRSRTCCASRWS